MTQVQFLDDVSWYAVSTRSRQEKVAASMLESYAIPHFLPLAVEKRQWSDRKQVVSVPLFPGYLFVRIPRTRELQLRVLKIPGVVSFIGNHCGPQPVPDAEIDGVRTVLSHQVPYTPCQFVNAGDRVRVWRGLLTGIEGTLVRSGSDSNLVISVETIQRSIVVHVDASDVEPAFCSTPSVFSGAMPMRSADSRP